MDDLPVGMMYQVCVVCNGTGKWDLPGGERDCEVCKPLRVMPVGVTESQLSRLHTENIQQAERLKELPGEVERNVLNSLAHGAVNCGQHSGCWLAAQRLADQRS